MMETRRLARRKRHSKTGSLNGVDVDFADENDASDEHNGGGDGYDEIDTKEIDEVQTERKSVSFMDSSELLFS
jgi:hypothetical protein